MLSAAGQGYFQVSEPEQHAAMGSCEHDDVHHQHGQEHDPAEVSRRDSPLVTPCEEPQLQPEQQERQKQQQQQQQQKLAAVQQLQERMLAATHAGVWALRESVLPVEELAQLLEKGYGACKVEPTLLELTYNDPSVEVVMVGDTHGQFHDVCNMLGLLGYPSEKRVFIFNGDYVDRGAWGLELLILLVSLKLAMPKSVYLVRGNHESTTCTTYYGFKGEVDAKYAGPAAKVVFQQCKKLFSVLPLAALVQDSTLIMHGGLFRHHVVAAPKKGGSKRGRRKTMLHTSTVSDISIGSLDDLRAAGKGGMDPDGLGSSVIAADVLWSDPMAEPGLTTNDARGVGLIFGPDVTQSFLERNNLRLVLRSHEGPDARERREDMPQVLEGFSLDHDTPAGKLMTIFSAPDYPQFQDCEKRYNNKGAVVVLSAPDYSTPALRTFHAALPRPKAVAYYDFATHADTDEEIEGNELSSAGTSCGASSGDEDVADSEVNHADASSHCHNVCVGTDPIPVYSLEDVKHMVGTDASHTQFQVSHLTTEGEVASQQVATEGSSEADPSMVDPECVAGQHVTPPAWTAEELRGGSLEQQLEVSTEGGSAAAAIKADPECVAGQHLPPQASAAAGELQDDSLEEQQQQHASPASVRDELGVGSLKQHQQHAAARVYKSSCGSSPPAPAPTAQAAAAAPAPLSVTPAKHEVTPEGGGAVTSEAVHSGGEHAANVVTQGAEPLCGPEQEADATGAQATETHTTEAHATARARHAAGMSTSATHQHDHADLMQSGTGSGIKRRRMPVIHAGGTQPALGLQPAPPGGTGSEAGGKGSKSGGRGSEGGLLGGRAGDPGLKDSLQAQTRVGNSVGAEPPSLLQRQPASKRQATVTAPRWR